MSTQQQIMQQIADYNADVHKWTLTARAELKAAIRSLGLVDKSELLKSLKTRERKVYGETDSVGFAFARHGIFRHKGVGRGRPIGSAKATAMEVPWFNPIINSLTGELENIVADHKAEMAINVIDIK